MIGIGLGSTNAKGMPRSAFSDLDFTTVTFREKYHSEFCIVCTRILDELNFGRIQNKETSFDYSHGLLMPVLRSSNPKNFNIEISVHRI